MSVFTDLPIKLPEKVPTEIVIVGILSLTTLEIAALICGINGIVFTTVVAIIALAIGVTIPTPKLK